MADELAHVGFESDLLRAMRARQTPMVRVAVAAAHRAFIAAASLVVWFTHRQVLRAAGYRMRSFWRACDAQYAFYFEPPEVLQLSPRSRVLAAQRATMTRAEE